MWVVGEKLVKIRLTIMKMHGYQVLTCVEIEHGVEDPLVRVGKGSVGGQALPLHKTTNRPMVVHNVRASFIIHLPTQSM